MECYFFCAGRNEHLTFELHLLLFKCLINAASLYGAFVLASQRNRKKTSDGCFVTDSCVVTFAPLDRNAWQAPSADVAQCKKLTNFILVSQNFLRALALTVRCGHILKLILIRKPNCTFHQFEIRVSSIWPEIWIGGWSFFHIASSCWKQNRDTDNGFIGLSSPNRPPWYVNIQ